MPIEVRELVIRATVEQSNGSNGGRTAPRGGSESTSNDCLTKMEEIKRMIAEKNER